jgi:DNA-binding transcriptional MerR regulator
MAENDEYVNTKKARELLDVTVKTLRLWDKEGKIRTCRTLSGQRRYNNYWIKKYR